MSRVMFATLCDECGRRSEEYASWLGCRGCDRDICTDCAVIDYNDADVDWCQSCLCRKCDDLANPFA